MRETSLASKVVSALRVPERGIIGFPTKGDARRRVNRFNELSMKKSESSFVWQLGYNSNKSAKYYTDILKRKVQGSHLLYLDDDTVRTAVKIQFDEGVNLSNFFKVATPPYQNVFVEWNDKVRVSEGTKVIKENLQLIKNQNKFLETYKDSLKDPETLIKVSNYKSILMKKALQSLSYTSDAFHSYDNLKIGYHILEGNLGNEVQNFEDFNYSLKLKLQNTSVYRFHPFLDAYETDGEEGLTGKTKIKCDLDGFVFDPDLEIDLFREIFEEQYILGSESNDSLPMSFEGFESGFDSFAYYQNIMSRSFFGLSDNLNPSTLDWINSKVLFNKNSNSEIFATDIESYERKLSLPEIWIDAMDKYKNNGADDESVFYSLNENFAPYSIGSFLLICLGLLNHQKTIYIDVPSKGQKREVSFGDVVPRKEYRIVNIKISDSPRIIENELSNNFSKETKKMCYHEMPSTYRKRFNGRELLHPPCGVSRDGVQNSRGCDDCWIRVKSHFRGDKKFGESHTDIKVSKDKKRGE